MAVRVLQLYWIINIIWLNKREKLWCYVDKPTKMLTHSQSQLMHRKRTYSYRQLTRSQRGLSLSFRFLHEYGTQRR